MTMNDTECIVESLFGSLHRWSKTLCQNFVPRGATLKQERHHTTGKKILMPCAQSGIRVLIRVRSSSCSDSDTIHGAFLGDGWEKDGDFKGSQQAPAPVVGGLVDVDNEAGNGIPSSHDGDFYHDSTDTAIYTTGTLLDLCWRETMSQQCDRIPVDLTSGPVGSSTTDPRFRSTSDIRRTNAIVMIQAEGSSPSERKRWQAIKKALGPNVLTANDVDVDSGALGDHLLVSIRVCDVFPFIKELFVSSTGAESMSISAGDTVLFNRRQMEVQTGGTRKTKKKFSCLENGVHLLDASYISCRVESIEYSHETEVARGQSSRWGVLVLSVQVPVPGTEAKGPYVSSSPAAGNDLDHRRVSKYRIRIASSECVLLRHPVFTVCGAPAAVDIQALAALALWPPAGAPSQESKSTAVKETQGHRVAAVKYVQWRYRLIASIAARAAASGGGGGGGGGGTLTSAGEDRDRDRDPDPRSSQKILTTAPAPSSASSTSGNGILSPITNVLLELQGRCSSLCRALRRDMFDYDPELAARASASASASAASAQPHQENNSDDVPVNIPVTMARYRDIFRRAEDICVVASSFVEMCTIARLRTTTATATGTDGLDAADTATDPYTDTDTLPSQTDMMITRELAVGVCDIIANTIDAVSKTLYLMPIPMVATTKDWSQCVCALLDARSAFVHGFTILRNYNKSLRSLSKYLRQSSSSQMGAEIVPLYALQDALNTLEEIIEEEVAGKAIGSMEQMFSSSILDDVTRQDWQSNSAFRKGRRFSHGISALVLTYRGFLYDLVTACSPINLLGTTTSSDIFGSPHEGKDDKAREVENATEDEGEGEGGGQGRGRGEDANRKRDHNRNPRLRVEVEVDDSKTHDYSRSGAILPDSAVPRHSFFVAKFGLQLIGAACEAVHACYSEMEVSRVRLGQWSIDMKLTVFAALHTIRWMQSRGILKKDSVPTSPDRFSVTAATGNRQHQHQHQQEHSLPHGAGAGVSAESPMELEHMNHEADWQHIFRIACVVLYNTKPDADAVVAPDPSLSILSERFGQPESESWSESLEWVHIQRVTDPLLSLMLTLFIRDAEMCSGPVLLNLLPTVEAVDNYTAGSKGQVLRKGSIGGGGAMPESPPPLSHGQRQTSSHDTCNSADYVYLHSYKPCPLSSLFQMFHFRSLARVSSFNNVNIGTSSANGANVAVGVAGPGPGAGAGTRGSLYNSVSIMREKANAGTVSNNMSPVHAGVDMLAPSVPAFLGGNGSPLDLESPGIYRCRSANLAYFDVIADFMQMGGDNNSDSSAVQSQSITIDALSEKATVSPAVLKLFWCVPDGALSLSLSAAPPELESEIGRAPSGQHPHSHPHARRYSLSWLARVLALRYEVLNATYPPLSDDMTSSREQLVEYIASISSFNETFRGSA